MENRLKTISCVSTIALAFLASAIQAQATTLLTISPNDYHYSVHLLHPYYNYWFAQGPLVEPIAFEALKAKDSEITRCKANETADTIIRIKPSLFYNPQMEVYHGRLVATVYSGGGNLLGTYVGKAQQRGFIGGENVTEFYLNKVYTLAMQDLMTKLEIKPALDNAKAENKLPCGLVGAQEEPKINFY